MSWWGLTPKPPTPEPPTGWTTRIHCTVLGTAPDVPLLIVDTGHAYRAVFESASRVTFTLDTEPPWGWAIEYGGKRERQPGPLPGPGDHEGPVLDYTPVSVFLPALEARGQFYYQQSQPFTVIECSDFRLFERYLRHGDHDITPILADRQAIGFNTVRIWLLNTSVGHIKPSEWPDFYDRLEPFLGLLGRFGLYAELTVFTQTQTLMPTLAQQQAHYNRVVAAIGARFCFVEGVNESDSHDNAMHPDIRLHRPAGATFDLCRGSNGSDAWALEPVIDSTRYHSNDAEEWHRRCAHNGMEMGDAFQRPNLANENTRPDRDDVARTTGDPRHFYDAAAGAALLSAGSCFHSQSGKLSVPLAGRDRTCATAWVAGARSVDLSQRVHPYVHRTDLEGPGILRAYQRGSQIVTVRA